MRRLTIMFLCLALLSLACMESSLAASDQLSAISTVTMTATQIHVAEPMPSQIVSATATNKLCAIVVAIEALHLRKGPSEKDIVLTWLKHGDVVQVLDQSNRDWWFIESRGMSGYARSLYLQERECD